MKTKVPFTDFSKAVYEKFESMKSSTLFVADVGKDDVWRTYLESFPDGSNEIFRERTEHDCNCCSQFIKRVGNVVAIIDGKVTSIWDVDVGWPYSVVADEMKSLVLGRKIRSKFYYNQYKISQEETISGGGYDGLDTEVFNHFHCEIPRSAFSDGYVSKIADSKQLFQSFINTLKAVNVDSLMVISGLIESGSIYRGNEFLSAVKMMIGTKSFISDMDKQSDIDVFIWQHLDCGAARFKSSVIGTLAVDLTDGVDLETAVAKYESKVAPENYKRPKSLITESMIKSALNTVDELGLRGQIDRRHASIDDVSVNDIIFVDNSVRPLMRDALSDSLMSEAKSKAKPTHNAGIVSIDEFISNVVPSASSIDIFFDSEMVKNLVSLTSPKIEGSNKLFKWDNDFSWSYNGGAADSIKQKVKNAGGDIDCQLRVSLSWSNYDDLDIHMLEPSGNHISYSNMSGKLDVDMNAGGRKSRDPVENIAINDMSEGVYKVIVNNYTKRESIDAGFCIEIEFDGQLTRIYSDNSPLGGQSIDVASITVSSSGSIEIDILSDGLTNSSAPVIEWGIASSSYHKVKTMMLSPNHWGFNSSGNKHFMFVVDGCENPEPVRGIYNEFLRDELIQHKKVFEILAQKTKCGFSENQLSGFGFSETIKKTIDVKVDGKPMTIKFN